MTSTQDIWQVGPGSPSRCDDEVHVWRFSLDQSPAVGSALWMTLSSDEQDRADRFHFEKHRQHFVIGRGGLRAILSRYVSLRPEQLRFSYSRFGKPALADDAEGETLRFNLSHAETVALCAVTCRREVGIDVEYLRPDFASMEIAERFFSAAETQKLRGLSAEAQPSAFFNCWTRKEAYIKALGEGLSHPLDSFTVSLAPAEPAALLFTESDRAAASRWTLKELPVGDNYVAAVAIEGQVNRFRFWQWTP
jgi:4'-phosphopantetheinyl transferase